MNSRERVKKVLAHEISDKIPVDFGGFTSTYMHVTCVAALRDYYGLEKRRVKLFEPFQTLGWIDNDLRDTIGSDVEGIFPRNTVLSKVPVETLKENFTQSAIDICKYAANRNVTVILEPINRFEGYPGFMNSLVGAVKVVNEIGVANLGVLGDLFHMNIEDVSICDAIRAAGKTLRHIHLADSNRQLPGTGHINFKAVLRTLTGIGFSGYMSLDCIPPKPDLKTFLESSMDYMKTMERAVKLQERT